MAGLKSATFLTDDIPNRSYPPFFASTESSPLPGDTVRFRAQTDQLLEQRSTVGGNRDGGKQGTETLGKKGGRLAWLIEGWWRRGEEEGEEEEEPVLMYLPFTMDVGFGRGKNEICFTGFCVFTAVSESTLGDFVRFLTVQSTFFYRPLLERIYQNTFKLKFFISMECKEISLGKIQRIFAEILASFVRGQRIFYLGENNYLLFTI